MLAIPFKSIQIGVSGKALLAIMAFDKTQILETGTEVNFIEISKYIEEMKNENNKFEKLEKYFEKDNNYVLMIGIKIKR